MEITKEKLKAMDEFEINVLTAKCLGVALPKLLGEDPNYYRSGDVLIYSPDGYGCDLPFPDYCVNRHITMGIAFKHKFEISWGDDINIGNDVCMVASRDTTFPGVGKLLISFNVDPLRAVLEVFILLHFHQENLKRGV